MDFGSLLRKKPKKVSVSPETFQLEQLKKPFQTQIQQSQKQRQQHHYQRPYSSSSNLSTYSNTSSSIASTTTNSSLLSTLTSLSRKSIYITLPQNLGIEINNNNINNSNYSLNNNGKVINIIKNSVGHNSGVIQIGDYIQIIEKDEIEELISLKVTFGILHIEQRPTYPFIIEIGNRSQTSLGIALSDSLDNKIYISSILPGSLVDRCGFIHAGDYLISIYIKPNEIITCSPFYTSQQIAKLLRKIVQQTNSTSIILTIFPAAAADLTTITKNNSINGSYRTLVDNRNQEEEEEEEEVEDDNSSSSEISNFTLTNEQQQQQPFLSSRENELDSNNSKQSILSICLWKDFLYEDWGFSLIDDENEKHLDDDNDNLSSAAAEVKYHKNCNGTLVNEIRNGGSAEVSGLKTGDKILQVNGRDVSNLKSTMIVPILASLEDALNLLILRNN